MSAERQWPDEAADGVVTVSVRRIDAQALVLGGLDYAIAVANGKLPAGGSPMRLRMALREAINGDASPVVALPPCSTCGGSGTIFLDTATLSGLDDCITCNGSGVERMVPVAPLRAWIEEQLPDVIERHHGHPATAVRARLLHDLSSFLDSLHAEPGTDRSER